MEKEFNLIDEPWIVVRTKDCVVREVSLKDALLNSHKYTELAGETKTQDLALLRLMLAVMYTVFSRYDADGNEIELADDLDFPVDNWETIWQNKQLPAAPIEKYFDKWYDRFWLFDDEYPFYQSNAVKGKTDPVSTAKLIGSLYESGNKPRLFSDRMKNGRYLAYSEAARWLVHLNGFDDIAAKKPTPKKSWNSKLGLIAVRGKNLFETLMLNFVADVDVENGVYTSRPSWENSAKPFEFNRLTAIPTNQAELLTVQSRQLYLYRENEMITGYYIAGGDYFDEEDVIAEQMTIWRGYKENKTSPMKFRPAKHDAAKSVWQEFGTIAAFPELKKGDNSETGERTPGVIKWIKRLCEYGSLERGYFIDLMTAAVIYDYGQATSLPVIDYISDSVTFHSQLLLDSGKIWRDVINEEIAKCEKAAKKVYNLSVNLQEVSGASGDRITGGDAKVQFYDRIDRTFRLWLEELDAESDKYKEYADKLEDKIFIIARDFGYELVGQTSANAIFGRYKKPENNEKCTSSAQALNLYISSIKKIFNKAGDKK